MHTKVLPISMILKSMAFMLFSLGISKRVSDIFTGMSEVFSINVYDLLDNGNTLSFLTPLVAKKFDLFFDALAETFSVTTLAGDSVVVRRVFKSFPISYPNRVSLVDLIELDMIDFNVILGMN